MAKTFDINVHGEQGDDFGYQLELANDDLPEALRKWAKNLREDADTVEKLAEVIQGLDVSPGTADGGFISIHANNTAAVRALNKALKTLKLL